MSHGDVEGIDYRYLSGFTARELLIEAAGTATEENDLGIKATAFQMLDLLKQPGTPSLSAAQVEAYVSVVDLACDYEAGVTVDEPDEYATEAERRSFAMVTHMDSLKHAVHWLGGK